MARPHGHDVGGEAFLHLVAHGGERVDETGHRTGRQAQQIRIWLGEGKDVFIYFNNDAFGYAVKNALTLKEYLEKE